MGDAPDVISFIASKARKHRRIARWNPLGQINRLRPLIQFDASSPRVGDECNPDANVVHAKRSGCPLIWRGSWGWYDPGKRESRGRQMIDNQDQVERLLRNLTEGLPLPAHATPSLMTDPGG